MYVFLETPKLKENCLGIGVLGMPENVIKAEVRVTSPRLFSYSDWAS